MGRSGGMEVVAGINEGFWHSEETETDLGLSLESRRDDVERT